MERVGAGGGPDGTISGITGGEAEDTTPRSIDASGRQRRGRGRIRGACCSDAAKTLGSPEKTANKNSHIPEENTVLLKAGRCSAATVVGGAIVVGRMTHLFDGMSPWDSAG